jgi:glucose/arabinose dehydrogenase
MVVSNPPAMKLFLRALFALVAVSTAPAAFPTLYLKNVCDDQLHAPTNITHAGDGSGRLFISDQNGKIYIFKDGMLLPTPFLDVGPEMVTFSTAYSERGLLGLCFHPDYENSAAAGYRCFYVNYTAPAAHPTLNPVGAGGTTNCVTVIAEYKVSLTNPNAADPATKRIVLTYGQPQSNHNGGQIEFGPDGLLYIASGDGGGANDNPVGHTEGSGPSSAGRVSGTLGNGQDRRVLLGKILRIDPLGTNGPGGTYGIPAGNPFVGMTQDFADNALDGPMRGEIYAYGLRNPWRFCFDADFGGAARLICADVGQFDVEEIDFITSGGNYGWRMKEGTVDFDTITAYGGSPPSSIAPVAQYAHPTALPNHGTLPGTSSMQRLGASITGGYVYHGGEIPEMQGKYVFADYAVGGITGGGGVLLGLEETAPGVFTLNNGPLSVHNPLPSTARIYCFGVDEAGEMYFATKTTSGVLALDGGKPAGTIYKIQALSQVSLDLPANRDNTMFEEYPTRSNGKGAHLYAGQIAGSGGEFFRRALLRFDLSSIPVGVTLLSASVSLTTTKQVSQDFAFTLHRATADWGEGNSNAGEPGGKGIAALVGDATWIYRQVTGTVPYAGNTWTSAGGDFIATPSATQAVGNMLSNPVTTWSSAALLADVNGWRATPATNFGWILRGTEVNPSEAQRFASREYSTPSDRPKLTVTFNQVPQPSFYESWLTAAFPTTPPGTYIDPEGDADGDGIENLVEYAYAYSPTVRNTSNGLGFSVGNDGTDTQISATFRRDPRAIDLTYELQVSEDLMTWNTVVTSALGGTPTGDAFVSESAISGESPLLLVQAAGVIAGLETRNFIRLKITRTP